MDQNQRLQVFQAQTENVDYLNKVRTQFTRSINRGLRENNSETVEALTKSLAIIYSAWVESNLSKLIHTPHGFTLEEISQIKKESTVEGKWLKVIELGLRRVRSSPKSNSVPNKSQKLQNLVQEFVIKPSIIRNKIAHGQWKVALNRENRSINVEISNEINELDVVKIDRLFETQFYISMIIEDFIESPDKTFHRDYWLHLTKLESYLEKTKDWTIESKVQKLKLKPIPVNNNE